jgi:hypothetical protein
VTAKNVIEILSAYARSFGETLIDKPTINKSLLTSNVKIYKSLKWLNIVCSLLLFVPAFASIGDFNLPHMIGYIVMAFLGYATWIFQGITGVPMFEETRFLTLLHLVLHSFFGMWLGFYNNFALFDDLLHVFGGFWGGFSLFPFIFGSAIAWSNLPPKAIKWKVWLSGIAIVNMAGVFWEIGEFVSDKIFGGYPGYRMAQENSLDDTMIDLIYNNIGATIGILLFWSYLRKSGDINTFMKNMGEKLGEFFEKKKPPAQ